MAFMGHTASEHEPRVLDACSQRGVAAVYGLPDRDSIELQSGPHRNAGLCQYDLFRYPNREQELLAVFKSERSS